MSASDVVVLLRIDPEYSGMMRRLTGAEFEGLKESIAEHGLFDKLILNQDSVLLDGHNRREALRELGLPVVESMVDRRVFDSRLDEKVFVVLSNLQRRHLTDFERGPACYSS